MNQRTAQRRTKRNERGFSMTELVVVVFIILVVAAIAIPNAVQAWYNAQLRASAAELSDFFQQARMLAARKNGAYPVLYQTTLTLTTMVRGRRQLQPLQVSQSSRWPGNLTWPLARQPAARSPLPSRFPQIRRREHLAITPVLSGFRLAACRASTTPAQPPLRARRPRRPISFTT